MEGDQGAISTNLLDRENRAIADVLSHFHHLVVLATEPVDNTASAGQAAYGSMAMEIRTKGLVKSAEDLLQLTRLLRELWITGPLRKPGEGEQEAEAQISTEVDEVVGLLNRLRQQSRQQLVREAGGNGTYVTTPPVEQRTGPRASGIPAGSLQKQTQQ